MKLLEVIELVGSKNPSEIKKYVNDALQEIGELTKENVTYTTIDVVSGTRAYSLPSNYIKVLGVYQLKDDGKYYEIPRINHISVTEDVTSGSTSGGGYTIL